MILPGASAPKTRRSWWIVLLAPWSECIRASSKGRVGSRSRRIATSRLATILLEPTTQIDLPEPAT
jgi:hypothetical protein